MSCRWFRTGTTRQSRWGLSSSSTSSPRPGDRGDGSRSRGRAVNDPTTPSPTAVARPHPAGGSWRQQGPPLLVFHHELADGIGALSILAPLPDGAPPVHASDFPRPAPSLRTLTVNAAATRLRAVQRHPQVLRRLSDAAIELGQSLRTHAALSSLNQPTGTHRQLLTVRSDPPWVIRLAH